MDRSEDEGQGASAGANPRFIQFREVRRSQPRVQGSKGPGAWAGDKHGSRSAGRCTTRCLPQPSGLPEPRDRAVPCPATAAATSPRSARPARGLFRRRAGGGGARPFEARAPEVVTRRRRGRKWTRPAAAGGRLRAAWGRQREGAGSAGPARPRVPMGGGGPGR